MTEETNYSEEIMSSEEEEMDEEGAKSSDISEGEDEDEGEKDDVEEPEDGESMDTMERESNVIEGNNKVVAMDMMGTPNSPVNNTSDRDDESLKSNDEEDKESSYRSSPPDSPANSPPPETQCRSGSVSPGPEPVIRDVTNSVNNIFKENIDDREGELDFEEDTAEDIKDETAENAEQADKEQKDEKLFTNDLVKANVDENTEAADADDDGEVEDDDDLEEGEVKDSSSNRKVPQRPMCRFFSKGQCTWGNNCRFLHPGINDKGNYNMFAPIKAGTINGPNSLYSWHAGGARPDGFYNKGFSDTVLPPPIIPPPPPAHDEPHRESAWERGLRHAKEILKKSSQRKEIDPDFEEKRLNLSLSSSEVYNDYEKENDYYSRGSPYRRNSDRYSYEYEDPLLDPYDRQAHEYWRGGNYENFEVRYMRSDYDYRDERGGERMRESERNRMERVREREVYHVERDGRSRRDKFERQHSPERSWRDEHYNEMQSQSRNRGDEWRDPWRRSTSPKRVDQRRSYSSNSSASYSSSRSSASHSSYTSASRSSSASSHSSYSSRSYSRSRMHVKPQMQHKIYTDQEVSNRRIKVPLSSGNSALQSKMPRHQEKWSSSGSVPAPMQITKTASPSAVSMDKKKMKTNIVSRQIMREGSLSSTGSSRSSHSVSSHTSSSRSRSRGSSASDLESVSSKSSISSKSSYAGGSQMKPQVGAGFKRDDRHLKDKRKLYDSGKSIEKNQQQSVSRSAAASGGSAAKVLTKDLLKHSGQKTQIKLTLLNKEKAAAANAVAISQPAMHRKEMGEVKKMKVVEKETVKMTKPAATNLPQNRKRAGSPLHAPTSEVPSASSIKNSKIPQTSTNPASSKSSSTAISAISKKSTSSRREELLKQLKAVEDAIARKRAKLS